MAHKLQLLHFVLPFHAPCFEQRPQFQHNAAQYQSRWDRAVVTRVCGIVGVVALEPYVALRDGDERLAERSTCAHTVAFSGADALANGLPYGCGRACHNNVTTLQLVEESGRKPVQQNYIARGIKRRQH